MQGRLLEVDDRLRVFVGKLCDKILRHGRSYLLDQFTLRQSNFNTAFFPQGFPYSIMAVPLDLPHNRVGAVALIRDEKSTLYREQDLQLLGVFASHTASALQNSHLYSRLRGMNQDVIRSFAQAVEAKDYYTRGHSERVAEYACRLAGIEIEDVASGFRAYSAEAAMRLTCSTDFDHTVDHTIQAGRRRIVTKTVPISTNSQLRESRLFSNIGVFVARSLGIMLRVYSSYRAMPIFATIGAISCLFGILIGIRFLYIFFFIPATADKHVQSLILAAILLIAGIQIILTGVIADLINSNRSLMEDVSYRLRRLEKGREEGDE